MVWVRRLAAGCLIIGASLLGGAVVAPRAAAQVPPADLQLTPWDGSVPAAPAGFLRDQVGDVTWDYHERARSVVVELQDVLQARWPQVVAELRGDADVDATLHVRVGRDPDEMRALAPVQAPPPAYATGVAYPGRGLILLTLSAPETWERPDMVEVLVHELSHIALHRVLEGAPIPRWFSEGVAVNQAGEQSLERVQTLWGATLGGRLLPLRRLDRGFSRRPHQVSLAYAQAADFVTWLRRRDDGAAQLPRLLARMRDGVSFEASFERTYSTPLAMLEDEWHQSLEQRFSALPLLLGSSGIWVIMALLIVVAFFRRKRQDRVRLDEWEREEELAMEAAAQALEPRAPSPPTLARRAMLRARAGASPASAPSGVERPLRPALDTETLDTETLDTETRDAETRDTQTLDQKPRPRDSGVPTIEHEGRSHTLH